MSPILSSNAYGKGEVRLTKVIREADRHIVKQITAKVRLTGDFADSYLSDDNSKVVPTDTIRNSVYALASKDPLRSIEEFGRTVVNYFLGIEQVESAEVRLTEHAWERLVRDGKPAPHTFLGTCNEKKIATVYKDADTLRIVSGIEDLVVLNTTNSAFKGYYTDDYTTLPETDDRILATNITATWPYTTAKLDFEAARAAIRGAIIDIFADTFSPSVQRTLKLMGDRALEVCDAIDSITFVMPNIHNIPFDLSRLGLENKNEIFVATSEPYGLIEGTVSREKPMTPQVSIGFMS